MADVSFVLELVDKMSSTADKMASALKGVEKQAHAAGKESDDFFGRVSKENKKVQEEFLEGLAEKFSIFALGYEGVKVLGELAEKAVEVGIEFGKSAIEAGLFEQKSTMAFSALMGDADKGKQVLSEVKGFANQFGESYEKISDLFRTGLLGGLKFEGKNSITELAQAAIDIENISGKQGMAKGIMQAFANIKDSGEFTARSLMAFKESGVPIDELAKKLGVASGSFKDLQKHLSQTHVTAEKGIAAVMSVLGDRFGTVGGASMKFGETLDHQIQRVKNTWDDMLGKFAETGALDKLSDIVGKFAEALPVLSPLFDDLFEEVTKFLEPLTTKEGMEDFKAELFEIGHAVEMVAKLTVMAADAIVKLGEVFGPVIKLGIGQFVGSLQGVEAMAQFSKAGGGPLDLAKAAFGAMFGGPAATSTSEGKLASFAEGGRVEGPTLAMLGEGGEGETVVPDSKMAAMGSRTVNAPIHQEIHLHEVHGAKEAAALIHRIGLANIQGALDTLAQQMGGGS